MKTIRILFFIFLTCPILFIACSNNSANGSAETRVPEYFEQQDSRLSALSVPEGFKIEIYADGLENARSLALSPSGVVYVSTRKNDKVFALVDTDKDYQVDKIHTVISGMKTPNGVAFKDGSLYVAEVNKLWRFDNIEADLANPPEPVLIYDDYPTDRSHGWKYIAFGPDGKLYVPVGAPCNICESENEIYASITRMNPDGSDREIFVQGVRNTVGFTWHPETGNLWFTDNGRDMLGDNMPDCELNKATKKGQHFGYPYCHAGDIGDPEFGGKYPCSDFVRPQYKLGPHVAPLGLKFYTGPMFPEDYKNDLIIAKHGSWNRSKKIGYEVTRVKVEKGRAVEEEIFITGWLDEEKQEAWGRPVDVLVLADGSVLVSDDRAGLVYRITYAE